MFRWEFIQLTFGGKFKKDFYILIKKLLIKWNTNKKGRSSQTTSKQTKSVIVFILMRSLTFPETLIVVNIVVFISGFPEPWVRRRASSSCCWWLGSQVKHEICFSDGFPSFSGSSWTIISSGNNLILLLIRYFSLSAAGLLPYGGKLGPKSLFKRKKNQTEKEISPN